MSLAARQSTKADICAGFAFRGGSLRFCLSHNPSKGLTSILMIASEAEKKARLVENLESCKTAILCPTLVPILAIESSDRKLGDRDHESYERLVALREEAGMDPFNAKDARQRDRELDLARLTRDLTELSGWVSACNWHQQVLVQTTKEAFRLHNAFITSVPEQDMDMVMPACRGSKERLEYLEALYARNELKYITRQTQVQAQIQTVYSMIATKDNNLNYKAAETSLQISKDSRKIAILSRQDSTDMRVIAVATLTFLPATFVAVSIVMTESSNTVGDHTERREQTLLSTTFFNFERSDSVVSPWVWLYFATTTGLTIILLLGGRYVSSNRKRETATILDLSAKEHDQADAAQHDTSFSGEFESSANGVPLRCLHDRIISRSRSRADEEANGV